MTQQTWNIGTINKGKPLPLATRKKISQKIKEGFAKGRKVWNEGKTLSAETKQKISLAKKGSSPWNIGIPRTKEERQKISLARQGKPAWNKGKERTEEEKQKMREGARRMWERRRNKILLG